MADIKIYGKLTAQTADGIVADADSIDDTNTSKRLVTPDQITEWNEKQDEINIIDELNWESITWTGLSSFAGSHIWTYDGNIYYSAGSDQYVLDKTTNTWVEHPWYKITGYDSEREPILAPFEFYGVDIIKARISFYDTDIIYSGDGTSVSAGNCYQYSLRKDTLTWEPRAWNEVYSSYNKDIKGRDVWTDGNKYYFSNESKQYEFDPGYLSWKPVTWTGRTGFYGGDMWSDGNNTYNSRNGTYCLSDNNTWIKVSTRGGAGANIWSDLDNNIYYDSSYYFDRNSIDWKQVKFTTDILAGDCVWTDGENVYYSSGTTQYKLVKKAHKAVTLQKIAESGNYTDLVGRPTYYVYTIKIHVKDDDPVEDYEFSPVFTTVPTTHNYSLGVHPRWSSVYNLFVLYQIGYDVTKDQFVRLIELSQESFTLGTDGGQTYDDSGNDNNSTIYILDKREINL